LFLESLLSIKIQILHIAAIFAYKVIIFKKFCSPYFFAKRIFLIFYLEYLKNLEEYVCEINDFGIWSLNKKYCFFEVKKKSLCLSYLEKKF